MADIGILVAEADTSPSGYAYKMIIPNGILSLTGAVATLDFAAGGFLKGALGSTDNVLLRSDGTGGVTAQGSTVACDDSMNLSGIAGITMGGNLTDYVAVNNGNPVITIGATAAESAAVQAVYDAGAQTLDYLLISTATADATADEGRIVFNVDGTDIATIRDTGVDSAGFFNTGGSGVFVSGSSVSIRDAGNTSYRNLNCSQVTSTNGIFNTTGAAVYMGSDSGGALTGETWNFRKDGTTIVAYIDASGNIFSTGTSGLELNDGGADGDVTCINVDLTSDANLKWDNTNGKFVFNKPLGMTSKVTATTAATLTAGQVRNGTIFATAAGTYVLPDISADTTVIGSIFYIISTGANAVVVDTEAGGGDIIVLAGTTLDAGDKISSDSSAGAMCMFIAYNSTTYYAYPIQGVWFDAGP